CRHDTGGFHAGGQGTAVSLLDRVRASVGPSAPDPSATTFGFDHVEIPKGDGSTRRLDRTSFEALPLQERIGLLVQGTLRFYRGHAQVAPSEAMRSAY